MKTGCWFMLHAQHHAQLNKAGFIFICNVTILQEKMKRQRKKLPFLCISQDKGGNYIQPRMPEVWFKSSLICVELGICFVAL